MKRLSDYQLPLLDQSHGARVEGRNETFSYFLGDGVDKVIICTREGGERNLKDDSWVFGTEQWLDIPFSEAEMTGTGGGNEEFHLGHNSPQI